MHTIVKKDGRMELFASERSRIRDTTTEAAGMKGQQGDVQPGALEDS